ncbi:MAG: hypothetical protein AAF737_08085 [Pseudomonadota bacterium]
MKRDLGDRAFSRPIVAGAMAFTMAATLAPNMALAGEELLVRKAVRFEECKQRTLAVPASLGARPDRVTILRDTGAEFQLKIAARQANLVIGCNKVSDQMEVYRTTPGDAPQQVALSDG